MEAQMGCDSLGEWVCYEAIVISYYRPLNPYLTIKKHMGEDLAEEYLQSLPEIAN